MGNGTNKLNENPMWYLGTCLRSHIDKGTSEIEYILTKAPPDVVGADFIGYVHDGYKMCFCIAFKDGTSKNFKVKANDEGIITDSAIREAVKLADEYLVSLKKVS